MSLLSLIQQSSLAKTLISFSFGSILFLAFAPYDYPIILFFSIFIYFWLLDSAKNIWHVILYSFVFGLGFFIFGISWIFFGVKLLSESILFALLATAGVIVLISLFISFSAIIYYLAKKCLIALVDCEQKRNSLRSWIIVFLLPTTWLIHEIIRLYIFGGFPWLILGYGLIDTEISGFASIIGVFGLSFLVCLMIAIIYNFCTNYQRSVYKITMLVIFIASVFGLGSILKDLAWTQNTNQSFEAAIVQPSIDQDKKWLPENLIPSIMTYKDMTRPHLDSDLILWPESAVAAYWHHVEPFFYDLKQTAKSTETEILMGIVTSAEPESVNYDDTYYNSMINLNTNQFYHKTRLVPFGERMPIRWLLSPISKLLKFSMTDFSIPELVKTVKVLDYSAALSICYEITFGYVMANRLPEADFLVNVSNDAWFIGTKQPAQHLQMARMRSIELGRYLIRGANTGISAIIDEKGQIVKKLNEGKRGVLKGNVKIFKGLTPYALIKDYPVYIAMLLAVMTVIIRTVILKIAK